MPVFDIFAGFLIRLAYFIDEWFYHIVGTFAVIYILKYLFIKDWNKVLLDGAQSGNLAKVENALHNNADVNALSKKDVTALMLACSKNHKDVAVRLLSISKCKLDLQDELGNTALFLSSKFGYIELVRLLLSRKADIKIPTNDGTTPLVIAAHEGHEDVVKLLLEKGADVKFKNKFGLNALNGAINSHHLPNGRLGIIKMILDSPAQSCNLESRTGAGWTALMKAAFKGHTTVVELLLAKKADVNARAENGFTPLIAAAQNGWIDVVRLLLVHGADLTAQLYDGSTALIAASYGGYHQIVELLLEHAQIQQKRLLSNSDAASIHSLVVNHRYKQGSTALMSATYRGFVDVAEVLVRHGIDVNAVNEEGWSALTVACEKGCYSIAKLLLDSGANANVCNKTGYMPIMYASKLGFTDIVEQLVSHGALVNHIAKEQVTGEMDAVGGGPAGVYRAVPGVSIIDGYLPPLMLAISSHNTDTARLLLRSGADANINMSRVTAVSGLVQKRDFSYFLTAQTGHQQGKDDQLSPTDENQTNDPALKAPKVFKKGGGKMTAKDLRKLEAEESCAIESILSELDEVNSICDYFSTPLMLAVFCDSPEMVALLLESVEGLEVEAVNTEGDTALVIAALIGNRKVIKLLLDKKAAMPTLLGRDRGKTLRSILYAQLRNGCVSDALALLSKSLYHSMVSTRSSVRVNSNGKVKSD